jgi:hypothetical protein
MINPYAIIGALLVLIGTAFGGMHIGKTMEREVWLAKEKKTTELVLAERDRLIAKNESDRQAYIKQAKQASDDHEKELEAINTEHAAVVAVRVRVPSTFLRPANPAGKDAGAGTVGPDTAGAQFLPEAFTGTLRQLAADADKAVADLRQLETAAKAAKCFEGYE